MNSIRLTGELFPILYTRYGAFELDGSGFFPLHVSFGFAGLSITPIMPLTISSMYVKSLLISPLLKTSIGLPSKIAFVNKNRAISGLPHGP